MKKIAFITSEDAEYGFKLTGVNQYIAKKETIISMLEKIIREPDTGLVIIDERLVTGSAGERLREIEHAWQGVLLILPSPERPEVEIEDYAVSLIRRAIGYHVRLRL